MAMLGAPVIRITTAMVAVAEQNASVQVRNFSDKLSRE
jgi:hypothetical protein